MSAKHVGFKLDLWCDLCSIHGVIYVRFMSRTMSDVMSDLYAAWDDLCMIWAMVCTRHCAKQIVLCEMRPARASNYLWFSHGLCLDYA